MPNRRDSFGRRLLHLRRDLQLTQLEVLDRLRGYGVGVNQSYISTLENSDDRIPNGDVVAGLARVLHTTTDYLLMLSDDPLPPNDAAEVGISEEAEELARIVDRLPPPNVAPGAFVPANSPLPVSLLSTATTPPPLTPGCVSIYALLSPATR